VYAVDFSKAAIQIVDWGWDIAFASPKVLFSSNDPCACSVPRWVDRRVTHHPNDVSLYECIAQGIGVGVWSYVIP